MLDAASAFDEDDTGRVLDAASALDEGDTGKALVAGIVKARYQQLTG